MTTKTEASQKTLKLFQPLAEVRRHKRWQPYLALILPLLLVAGLTFFPPAGYSMFLWMAVIMGFGIVKGRYFCDWMCPRGSFWDSYLSRLSLKRRVPRFFRHNAWRLFWLSLLMTVLIVMVIRNWGDWWGLGRALSLMILVTTGVGVVLGIIYNQRTWCWFCPFGTMSNWLGRGKHLLRVSPECLGANCKLCYEVCRMQIHAGTYKEVGKVQHGDCLKCSRCIEVCPKEALTWAGPKVPAAEARLS